MIGKIAHVGITVSNMDNAIKFYGDILGLKLTSSMIMEGHNVEVLTGIKDAKLKVVYFNSSDDLQSPPIELLEFIGCNNYGKTYDRLSNVGISEVCFFVKDIDETYKKLKEKGVQFLSEPQFFDLTSQSCGMSKAVYFKDNDGTILELIQPIK
ncbi:VOC family protein [Hathewaya massiliensis]|uniref:VOC family protein n=1 Tax=Hathewaya massiliensis TaxID=1964382 RepID=UPI001159BCD4|nr:VOC family protein [Hathewaya massiliensis]